MKNKQIYDSWTKVQIDSAADQRILNAVLAQNSSKTEKRGVSAMNKKKFSKLAYVLSALLLVSVLAAGAVFAKDIKALVVTMLSLGPGEAYPISKIAPVKIKDTAIASRDFISMSLAEAEEMLGVKFLTTPRATTDVVHYSTELSRGKIGLVALWCPQFISFGEDEEKYISLSLDFLTPEAGRELIEPFEEGIDASGGKEIRGTYSIESLGEVVLYGNSWDETRLTATFVYNDMLYTFIAYNLSSDEVLEILESLS